jgi:hypothetical protein
LTGINTTTATTTKAPTDDSNLTTSQPGWVIVLIKPGADEATERSLRQAGYRVYLPRYRKMLRTHKRWVALRRVFYAASIQRLRLRPRLAGLADRAHCRDLVQ